MLSSVSIADIEKLSNFRSGLKQYLHNSHLFCEVFELTDLQYVFLLTVKALEASNQATHLNIKDKLQILDSVLTKLIKRSLGSNLLSLASAANKQGVQAYQLTQAGNRMIDTLAAMHKKEFESFQHLFTAQCETHCQSPICWKGSD